MLPLHPVMNCNATIPVKDISDATLHTRQAAVHLLEAVAENPCDYIELDFAEIEYISRSFADEFHAEKIKLAERSGKTILVTNANEEVVKMLQAVANTQHKINRSYEKVQVYNYTDWKNLERFLLSI